MNELGLFAGAGGGLLASKWLLGWRTVCYVENDAYCVKVIKARIKDGFLDDAPIWDDARTFDGKPWRGAVDIISAGFPCQPFSVAGKRRADTDERNLWPDIIRIIREIKPRFCFLENVPGLLAKSHGYFGTILRELAESGYDARWRVLSAAEVGAPHKRDRLWIVANITDTRRTRELPELSDAKSRACSWWKSEPEMARVVHGMAHWLEQIRVLGQGQVPAVAALAWELLKSASPRAPGATGPAKSS